MKWTLAAVQLLAVIPLFRLRYHRLWAFQAFLTAAILVSLSWRIDAQFFAVVSLMISTLRLLACAESIWLLLDGYSRRGKWAAIVTSLFGGWFTVAVGWGVNWRFGVGITLAMLLCCGVAAFQFTGIFLTWKEGYWRNRFAERHATLLAAYLYIGVTGQILHWWIMTGRQWRAVNATIFLLYCVLFLLWAKLLYKAHDQHANAQESSEEGQIAQRFMSASPTF